jgi:hypothetical protein
MTFRDFSQGAYRMRGIGQWFSLKTWASAAMCWVATSVLLCWLQAKARPFTSLWRRKCAVWSNSTRSESEANSFAAGSFNKSAQSRRLYVIAAEIQLAISRSVALMLSRQISLLARMHVTEARFARGGHRGVAAAQPDPIGNYAGSLAWHPLFLFSALSLEIVVVAWSSPPALIHVLDFCAACVCILQFAQLCTQNLNNALRKTAFGELTADAKLSAEVLRCFLSFTSASVVRVDSDCSSCRQPRASCSSLLINGSPFSGFCRPALARWRLHRDQVAVVGWSQHALWHRVVWALWQLYCKLGHGHLVSTHSLVSWLVLAVYVVFLLDRHHWIIRVGRCAWLCCDRSVDEKLQQVAMQGSKGQRFSLILDATGTSFIATESGTDAKSKGVLIPAPVALFSAIFFRETCLLNSRHLRCLDRPGRCDSLSHVGP